MTPKLNPGPRLSPLRPVRLARPGRLLNRPWPAVLAGGFTLVEVLVTVVVIAVGCLAALYMQAAAMGGNAQSDHLTAAASLGESELERLKALSFGEATQEAEDHESSPKVETELNRQGRSKASGAPGPWPYTRSVRYRPKQPTSLSHLVEVSVTWKDSQGHSRQLDYSAVLTNFSLGSD